MGDTLITSPSRHYSASARKSSPKGVSSVQEVTIRNNLMGVSRYMNKKGWIDSQGRKGKGYGVYRFASKYGSNVDGYSPIYSPDEWSSSGNSFALGAKGLLAWAGLLLVLLSLGLPHLIYQPALALTVLLINLRHRLSLLSL